MVLLFHQSQLNNNSETMYSCKTNEISIYRTKLLHVLPQFQINTMHQPLIHPLNYLFSPLLFSLLEPLYFSANLKEAYLLNSIFLFKFRFTTTYSYINSLPNSSSIKGAITPVYVLSKLDCITK